MSAATVQPQSLRGIVKQVLSGDSVIIRGQPKGGPPPERQINFASVSAPRLARRPAGQKSEEVKDEPFAWEAREFLRKKLIGKEVLFIVEYKVQSGREFGTIYVGKDVETGENITDLMINEGLVSVRREGKSDLSRLIDLEESAKSARKGKWATDAESHIRDITWQIEATKVQQYVDKMGRKPIQAVVEHVRDGSTVRVFLLPSFHYITLMMSGIRAPVVKLDAEGKPDKSQAEPFSEEARYFTESRLLQRDVEVVLESFNNANFVGSIIHPNGNIAELLLKEGFAKCIDWSMGSVTGGAEKLRAAEKFAKEKKLRIWKDYQVNTSGAALLKGKDKDFIATVTECVNGDALMVKTADGTVKKIFLAGIRPPREDKRPQDEEKKKEETTDSKTDKKQVFRPLYDIPYMFEARESLRKKLIGKKVHVTVDYIQPPLQTEPVGNRAPQPEKVCCTVKHEGINIGESLVSKGYCTVVRYRQDDDQRASDYDSLLAAEARAQKAQKGLHKDKKDAAKNERKKTHTVIDITGDAAKAKQFFPFFQRAGKTSAIVEFVASGSRLRLFVPRDMRLITFLLGGISCPRAPRSVGTPGSAGIEGEPFGEEALNLTKDLCLQREVEIEVDSMDKAGNFIGFLWVDGRNLNVALVEEGLSVVHFTADRTQHFRALQVAEEGAKARRDKIWANYEEIKEELKPEDDKVERKVDQKSVIVTEITSELRLFVQYTDDGDKLENLMSELRKELTDKPPLTGAYTPKKGDICVARYSADNEWYRAKVEKISQGEVSVLFIDYGNRETVKSARCAQLPSIGAVAAPAFAKEYALACVSLPSDEEYAADAVNALRGDTAEGKFLLNVEYKKDGIDCITLVDEGTKEDVGERLVRDGLFLVEGRKERRLQKLLRDYKAAETEAKKNHNNIWRYGDITEDDAREFGLGR